MALFESYERREKKILSVLKEYGIKSIEECRDITMKKGIEIGRASCREKGYRRR